MTRAQLDLGQQLALEWSMERMGTLIARDADHHRQSLLRKLYWGASPFVPQRDVADTASVRSITRSINNTMSEGGTL